MTEIKNCFKSAVQRLKDDKIRLILFILYMVFTVFSTVYVFVIVKFIRNGFMPIVYAVIFVGLLSLFEYFLSMRCSNVFIVILFSVPVGGILGCCYDFYHIFPYFDNLLHTVSGFIFAALGFSLMMSVLGGNEGKSFSANLMFGSAFSLGLAALWELFEWVSSIILGIDMLGDTYVTEIRSFLLSGTHTTPLVIGDIERTEIYYGDGQVFALEGYLDLGGIDSMIDMGVCLIGAVIFAVVAIAARKFSESTLDLFVPVFDKKENKDTIEKVD